MTIVATMTKLPEYPHFNTQTPALGQRLAATIAAIPAAHLPRPVTGEVFADPEDAFVRLRDWGFTQGILLVKKSTNNKRGRWQIDCSRHHKETRNWRETPAEERQRLRPLAPTTKQMTVYSVFISLDGSD
jgi:hypothetical protein